MKIKARASSPLLLLNISTDFTRMYCSTSSKEAVWLLGDERKLRWMFIHCSDDCRTLRFACVVWRLSTDIGGIDHSFACFKYGFRRLARTSCCRTVIYQIVFLSKPFIISWYEQFGSEIRGYRTEWKNSSLVIKTADLERSELLLSWSDCT